MAFCYLGKKKNKGKSSTSKEEGKKTTEEGVEGKGKGKDTFDCDVDYSSEELDFASSDEDGVTVKRKTYPFFKMPRNMADHKWELGTYFASRDHFKEAVRNYAIRSRRDLKIQKNDNVRVRVICKKGCEWMLYCAKLPDEDTWQLVK